MTALPGLVEMRSMNKIGLSLITLVFTDETDVFFARQLVMERLIEVSPRLLPGITPVLGPVSTGLGEVYQYTIEHPGELRKSFPWVAMSWSCRWWWTRTVCATMI